MPALRKLYKENSDLIRSNSGKIRQDVSELKNESLENLRNCLMSDTRFLDGQGSGRKPPDSFVSMVELRTCYPLRSLCLKKCPCSLYQRRSRSVKGAFTCPFGIPRAANLLGANNSQTTPGIVGADRFSRCRFFIFRGVCRRDLSAHR